MSIDRVVSCLALVLMMSTGLGAQSMFDVSSEDVDTATSPPSSAVAVPQESTAGVENPWGRRPVCASMFLKSDWHLTTKQRTCDWIRNRMFSDSAIMGAAWSAGVSQVRGASAEQGDPYGVRFGRRFAQSAMKSTASYLASLTGEDLRNAPPYLVMQPEPRPRGFWKRTGYALSQNIVAYRCANPCTKPSDIKRRAALAPVMGSLASGYGSEVWTWDRDTSHQRALRGAASAYGATFLSAWVSEFRPEISAAAGRVLRLMSGTRR